MDYNVIGYPLCFVIGVLLGRYIWPRVKKTLTGRDILKRDILNR